MLCRAPNRGKSAMCLQIVAYSAPFHKVFVLHGTPVATFGHRTELTASRPVVYFALPFGFACTVGIVSVVLIASALRQLTVQRTVEWLAASAASVGSE